MVAARISQSWSEFREGATRSSLPALLIAFVVVLTWFSFAFMMVTPEKYMNGGYRYFMAGGKDYYASVTAQAMKLSRAPQDNPSIVIIGASSIRAIISSEEDLSRWIAEQTGIRPDVHLLCVGGLRPWEMAALAGQIGPNFDGIVLMDLGVNRLSRTRTDLSNLIEQPRLGFVSEVFDSEIELSEFQLPHRSGRFILDNANFFLARTAHLALNLIKGPVEYQPHRHQPGPPMDEARWRSGSQRIKKIQAEFDANVEQNLAVVTRIIERLKAHDVTTVFLEAPMNPRFIREEIGEEVFLSRRQTIEQYISEQQVPFWNLVGPAELVTSDYRDWA